MLIAVDHGNYSVKTPNFSFISGLSGVLLDSIRPAAAVYAG